jgi:hypothetical protein
MAVPWLVYDNRYYEQPGLLRSLSSHGVNLVNWLFTSWDIQLLRDSYQLYSMEDARKFDLLLTDAEVNGIKLVLGIWIHDLLRDAPHPWSGFYDWGSNPFNQLTPANEFFTDSLSWEYQKKYYRYIIARWGYSSSVGMWHTVAEINGTNAIYDDLAMKNHPDGWHHRINRFFEENDPFAHPTTVSGSGGYDFSEGWEITGCPQAHEYPYPADRIKENPDRIAYWSDLLNRRYQKPALVGEFGKSVYEEGVSERFLHNGIWAGVMSGACSTPLHWWGGQIASQPDNFSTFNETMMMQLQHLGTFLAGMDMAAHRFTPWYGAPEGERPTLTGMEEGKIYGLQGDSVSLAWVYHVHENSTQDFSGVEVTIPGLMDASYSVSFYNGWTGEWDPEVLSLNAEEGTLRFTCPDFTGDVALKIEVAGPSTVSATGPPGPEPVRIFPNPCHSVLQIENLHSAETLRILTLTGEVLETHIITQPDLLSLDLSHVERGMYLLEIRDESGLPGLHKIVLL